LLSGVSPKLVGRALAWAYSLHPNLPSKIDMPLYDFKCETCGIFDKWRPLAESDTPVLCPSCETVAKRIFSPPMILTGKLRLKGQENREPQVIKRSEEPLPQRNREHRGGRPWMIGH
jgi:putative FmdB family regulatory protein